MFFGQESMNAWRNSVVNLISLWAFLYCHWPQLYLYSLGCLGNSLMELTWTRCSHHITLGLSWQCSTVVVEMVLFLQVLSWLGFFGLVAAVCTCYHRQSLPPSRCLNLVNHAVFATFRQVKDDDIFTIRWNSKTMERIVEIQQQLLFVIYICLCKVLERKNEIRFYKESWIVINCNFYAW